MQWKKYHTIDKKQIRRTFTNIDCLSKSLSNLVCETTMIILNYFVHHRFSGIHRHQAVKTRISKS